jgi:hypothetical protein
MNRMTSRAVCIAPIICALLLLSSCAKQQGAANSEQSHATILMRDGTTVSGTVTATSPTEITLASDNGVTQTVPTKQIKSIEYDDAAAAAAPAAAPASPASSQAPAAAAAASVTRAQSDSVHEQHYHPSRAEIHTKTYQLPIDTQVSVRSEETIDSATAAEGQTYAGEIVDDVLDSAGDVVIPHGSNAQIIIRSASKGNRFRGASDLVLDLRSVSVEGQEYMVSTTDIQQSGKQGLGANKRTAEYTGGGAALGAIIGAIAGRGKGAAIGAGAGGAGGLLTQVLTKGGSIRVPAETVLTFKLDKPVQIVVAK